MIVIIVMGGLLAVLAVACWWEARSGKPAWGAHLNRTPGGNRSGRPMTHDTSLGTAALMMDDEGGGGDG